MGNTKVKSNRDRRRARIRAKISGTAERPRLCVFKSNTRIYAQVINDASGSTLANASGTKAEEVGAKIAEAALKRSVKNVVFDRGGYIYTGKVQALAESARKSGLKF